MAGNAQLPRYNEYRNQLPLALNLLFFGLAHVLSTNYAHVARISDHIKTINDFNRNNQTIHLIKMIIGT